jgi:hypothetical protein
MGAAVLLCAADWIEQEAQDAAGSLGGQLSGASFTPLSFWLRNSKLPAPSQPRNARRRARVFVSLLTVW